MSADTYFLVGGIFGFVVWIGLIWYVVIADYPFNYGADWSARGIIALWGVIPFAVAIIAWPVLLLSAPAFAIRCWMKGSLP